MRRAAFHTDIEARSYWFEWRSLSHRSEPLSRRIKRLRMLLTSTFRPFFSPSCPLRSPVERSSATCVDTEISFSIFFPLFSPSSSFLCFCLFVHQSSLPFFGSVVSTLDLRAEGSSESTSKCKRDDFTRWLFACNSRWKLLTVDTFLVHRAILRIFFERLKLLHVRKKTDHAIRCETESSINSLNTQS